MNQYKYPKYEIGYVFKRMYQGERIYTKIVALRFDAHLMEFQYSIVLDPRGVLCCWISEENIRDEY